MKWFMKLIILISLFSKAYGVTLTQSNGKAIEVDVDGKRVYSKDCSKIYNCFKFPKKLKFYPNQSPLFSLCYQSGGTPEFVNLEGEEHKIEFCFKDNKGVDLETLMKAYKALK